MALVVTICNHSLPRLHELFDKRSLIGFTGTQGDSFWDSLVKVESQMNLGLFDTVAIVGKFHCGNGINQGKLGTLPHLFCKE